MRDAILQGRSILIVEDEPLIALDLADCLRSAGASVMTALNLCDGLRLAEHPDLSAAIVDFGLKDGEATVLCERLTARRVPYLVHTGYAHAGEICRTGVVLLKPATAGQIVRAIGSLLAIDSVA